MNLLFSRALVVLLALAGSALAEPASMFDGKTFEGWETPSPELWRVEDGAFVGGTLSATVAHNDFLSTKKSYKNFELRLKFKLQGTGFVNGGVQFRSDRLPPFEMKGYQADLGDPAYWGSLYDESRRNRALVNASIDQVNKVLRRNDWNDYRLRCVGPRIQLWLNGLLTVDYIEREPGISQAGKIGLQIHGGGKTEAWYKDLHIEELPDSMAAVGLPLVSADRRQEENETLKALAKSTPQDATAEHAAFHLPEGFVAELVADESVMHKAAAMNFDSAGRLWVTTAGEYPLDGNEQPERAATLYREGGKDAVLVFDTPCAPGLQKPRVFAGDPDGRSGSPFKLAMPLGVLPYKDGAIIHHGPDLVFLHDTKGTGQADRKEVLLHGFGVDDSHLMPHGFTRGPGDWMYFAQGAFNKSKVETKEGTTASFTYCKVMRMKLDGSRFEVCGWGPCNVWGFVIDPRGEFWAQEANDYGFPLYPFELGIAIPGIGSDRPHPYSPLMPPPQKLNDCTVGGTGLSGLALSEDSSTWPEPYTGAFILANPITNRLQVMRAQRTLPGYDGARLEMLGDLLKSDDPQFRPVAVRFGPDGALYVNDWYNKIISHNEVPRNHPERDKVRTRIWRIRWVGAAPREIPNLQKLPPEELIAHLSSDNAWEANAARGELSDRGPSAANWPAIALELSTRLHNSSRSVQDRLLYFWALEGAGATDSIRADGLLGDAAPEIRREAVRLLGELTQPAQPEAGFGATLASAETLQRLSTESDPLERIALARTVEDTARAATRRDGSNSSSNQAVRAGYRLLLALTKAPLAEPGPNAEGAAQRSFERAQIRAALELRQADLAAALTGDDAPLEGRLIGILALAPREGAPLLVKALPEMKRTLTSDEMALLSGQIAQPAVREAFAHALNDPVTQKAALAAMEKLPSGLAEVDQLIVTAARGSLSRDASSANQLAIVRLARVHRLAALEPEVIAFASNPKAAPADLLEAVKALRELGSEKIDLFRELAVRPTSDPAVTEEIHQAAVSGLASVRSPEALPALAALWPQLPRVLREVALDKIVSSKAQAAALVAMVRVGQGFTVADLNDVALDKLSTVLGENQPDLASILQQAKGSMQPVLRLTGKAGDVAETSIDLNGPFTVETWIKLDDGISNQDSILGAKGGPIFNFYDARFRVYVGKNNIHDALIAKTAMRPDLWTHVAVTRDAGGHFRIFIQGELDAEGGPAFSGPFSGLNLGVNTVDRGTSAALTEYRVWDIARTPEEILSNYQRSFAGEPLPAHLVRYFTGAGPWGKLGGQAHVMQTRDFPELLDLASAKALEAKFARFRQLIAAPGDPNHGHALFVATCEVCHRAKGEGAQIGPELSGAGAMGDESLLRNILTPNERIESGYYRFDVELKSGDLLTGFFVREDPSGVVIRPIGADDRTIPRSEIRSAKMARKSIMPEGLLDAMPEKDVADLFAYLRTLH